jgi:hypothetical protein
MDPITQRILDQQRAITQNPDFNNYQPSNTSLDQDIMNMQSPANGIVALNSSNQNVPVNQDIMFQDNLVPDSNPIDLKGMAKSMGKKIVTDFAIKKLGLDGIKANVLKSAVGSNLIGFSNPLSAAFTVGSLLPDSVKGIAGILRGKIASKAIARDILDDKQGTKDTTISPKITNMQPTAQDIAMGGGGDPSPKGPSPKGPSRSPHQGSGTGGLHSGY